MYVPICMFYPFDPMVLSPMSILISMYPMDWKNFHLEYCLEYIYLIITNEVIFKRILLDFYFLFVSAQDSFHTLLM